MASQSSKKGTGLFNPWPGYKFTGNLQVLVNKRRDLSVGDKKRKILRSLKEFTVLKLTVLKNYLTNYCGTFMFQIFEYDFFNKLYLKNRFF